PCCNVRTYVRTPDVRGNRHKLARSVRFSPAEPRRRRETFHAERPEWGRGVVCGARSALDRGVGARPSGRAHVLGGACAARYGVKEVPGTVLSAEVCT